MGWVLYPGGVQGCAWRLLWVERHLGSRVRDGKPYTTLEPSQACRLLQLLQRMLRKMHLEALLKLVLQDRAASRALGPAAAAQGASVVGLLKTHSSTVALEVKRLMSGC